MVGRCGSSAFVELNLTPILATLDEPLFTTWVEVVVNKALRTTEDEAQARREASARRGVALKRALAECDIAADGQKYHGSRHNWGTTLVQAPLVSIN